ncbi:MAG TPA: leucine zipper domain-containing protein [Dermatophilaceae bacterium]|uniref:Helix-turn-helix domain-containing protein n=1 Tax=Candidatus Phosphoribacter hodrii TaxID=2953743 RepID=A0A9D7XXE4_9MICO|nr:helix-turn-helix domain-containing protein [Candidatus Phosphoribacter hodrii]HQG10855.1 leucine zipper domain-containing protein [Dermatophilaceae bacterium]
MITAVVEQHRPVREVAASYGVARSWVYELLARWRVEGEAAFEPRSRRPHSCPAAVSEQAVAAVLAERDRLVAGGHDAGATAAPSTPSASAAPTTGNPSKPSSTASTSPSATPPPAKSCATSPSTPPTATNPRQRDRANPEGSPCPGCLETSHTWVVPESP